MLIGTVLLWINDNLLSEAGKFLFVYKSFKNTVDAYEIFSSRWAVSIQTHVCFTVNAFCITQIDVYEPFYTCLKIYCVMCSIARKQHS